MGFATAVSGLTAASTNLQVIGNNIANANTTGFKESRAEFADIYNNNASTSPGAGVRVSEVAQQFNQGNIESTQNSLDLALSGNGFFAMTDKTDATIPTTFTRNGAFHLNAEGYMTDDTGRFLLGGLPLGDTVAEGFSTGAPEVLRIDVSQGAQKATSKIDLKVNLDSRGTQFTAAAFPGFTETISGSGVFDIPPDPNTYNNSTSSTIFDSLGNTHRLSIYYVDITDTTANPIVNQWESYAYIDGKALNYNGTSSPATLTNTAKGTILPLQFDGQGVLETEPTGTDVTAGNSNPKFTFNNIDVNPLVVGADPLTFTVDPTGSTHSASAFGVSDLQQDGFASGNLTGIDIDKDGIVMARFSNGSSTPLGQVLLGRFTNNQGLAKIGDTSWQETNDSGTVVLGVAGGINFGQIRSSSLENSNTDIATQLVRLIVAQQTYQANSKTVSTENEIIQNILNI